MHTILIVDDEERLRKALQRSLGQGRFQTLTATCAEQALALLAKTEIDLVITDLVMPGMDGMALTRQIRRDHAEMKIIIMTAYGSAESTQEAEALGVSAYLAKPFDLADLKARVGALLPEEAPAESASCSLRSCGAPAAYCRACSATGKAVGLTAAVAGKVLMGLRPRNVLAAAGKATGLVAGIRSGLSGLASTLKRREVNHE